MIWALIGVAVWAAGLWCAVDVLRRGRTPQGTIGWLVALLLVPPLSVPLYLVIGRSRFEGYRSSQQDVIDATEPLADQARQALERADVVDGESVLARAHFDHLSRLPATRGNAVSLLVDGEEAFADMIAGIEGAERSVLAEFFIVRDDRIGQRFTGALCERARAGVAVHLLYDDVGSKGLDPAAIAECEDAGVVVSSFNPLDSRVHRLQLNFRNHRKILVVDGRQAWLGGFNVGDEYLGRDPDLGPWRDTHVRIEGPAALAAQLAFCSDWRWAADEIPGLDWTPAASDGDAIVQVVPTDPADGFERATMTFLRLIASARERLWIASPYFVPDAATITALQAAALAGVDVRILFNERSDHRVADLAALTFLEKLLPVGVRVFRYGPGMLHQKVVVSDEAIASVGSINFDNRSLRLNFEITMLCADPDFVTATAAMLEDDFGHAREVSEDPLANGSTRLDVMARLARLFSPVL